MQKSVFLKYLNKYERRYCMKKVLMAVVAALILAFAVAAIAEKGLPVYKAGNAVYVCACGKACSCNTISRKAGKCGCGVALTKGVVAKVEGDKIHVTVNGEDRVFSARAKYACACGQGCDCGTISQKPGNCACGKAMKAVE
jgi:hypothetical protein